ncbi:MAG: zinc ribbon domain-containing protein [Methanocorpusculum sp.]|uniref:zinc ribbon domain-containing protein n=1 Tax=Methanocorpusculum sp. TaxID=2058474 RepID=UPI002B204467|nr:zinc ribbon domain-containing protein [Methanocorpusculum sp.]MEA5087261.1 zinc ribbon domain-containing protein [Methanocorpusculum sp.]
MKEERNDDQILVRLPSGMKSQMETAAKVEGVTTQEWVREAMRSLLCLLNVCPKCSLVNAGKAKFCSECGTPLGESKRAIYREWVGCLIREEFGEAGWTLKADDLS